MFYAHQSFKNYLRRDEATKNVLTLAFFIWIEGTKVVIGMRRGQKCINRYNLQASTCLFWLNKRKKRRRINGERLRLRKDGERWSDVSGGVYGWNIKKDRLECFSRRSQINLTFLSASKDRTKAIEEIKKRKKIHKKLIRSFAIKLQIVRAVFFCAKMFFLSF